MPELLLCWVDLKGAALVSTGEGDGAGLGEGDDVNVPKSSSNNDPCASVLELDNWFDGLSFASLDLWLSLG